MIATWMERPCGWSSSCGKSLLVCENGINGGRLHSVHQLIQTLVSELQSFVSPTKEKGFNFNCGQWNHGRKSQALNGPGLGLEWA